MYGALASVTKSTALYSLNAVNYTPQCELPTSRITFQVSATVGITAGVGVAENHEA
jgi:hypothetical protein